MKWTRRPSENSSAPGRNRNLFRHSFWYLLLPVTALLAVPVAGDLWDDDLIRLFRQAKYDDARDHFATGRDAHDDDAWFTSFWEMQLTQDPAAALAATAALLDDRDTPDALRQRAGLEQASIHFARGDYRQALIPLVSLAESQDRLSGEHYLLMGLCYWSLRNIQQSREAFATIPQSDPNFVWARYYLGQLGLETSDPTLALRYFESADRSDLAQRTPSLLAGQWEVLEREGEMEEATALRNTVLQEHPYSLAAIRIRHLLDRAAEDQQLDLPVTGIDSITTEEPASRGRFSLQLAAFADRSRALTYLASWQDEVPGLRIDEEMDPEHPVLYKIRLGNFISRSQARTEAERLSRLHGLDALIVESGP